MKLSCIERANDIKLVDRAAGLWESGDWCVSADNAAALVGGQIFFHSAWAAESHHGGNVVAWRACDQDPRRVVFQYTFDAACVGVKFARGASRQAVAFWR